MQCVNNNPYLQKMKYSSVDIVFQEIPGEITMAFLITGCPLRCRGCHSADTWNAQRGNELSKEVLTVMLDRYQTLITTVLFMGGEWEEQTLCDLLDVCIQRKVYTALYTGLDQVSTDILCRLTFIKTGKWDSNLGGLESRNTNQRLVDLRTHETLNHYFWIQP